LSKNKATVAKPVRVRDFTWPSPRIEILIWLGITALYFLRVLYLDADAAPWGVVTYQPIDEGVYGDLALNVINFGSMNPNDYYQGLYQYQMQAHVISGFFTNMVVLFFLKLFGDTYYGFRMGSVVVGYLILLLFYLTLKEMARKAAHKAALEGSGPAGQGSPTAVGFAQDAAGRRRCLAAFACVLVLLFSFVFYDACRFVEPSIYRLLFVQAIIYCFIKESFSIRVKAFLIGFLWICSVFFVYITNVFVGLPILVYLVFLLMQRRSKEARDYLLYGLLGLLSAYALALIYYGVVWGTSPLANLISGVLIFQQQGYNYGNYKLAAGMVQNIQAFLTSNIVLYGLPLLPLLFLGLPKLVRAMVGKEEDILFVFFLVIGMLLQVLVSQDYITRKAIIIFPAVLLLVYRALWSGEHQVGKPGTWLVYTLLAGLTVAIVMYVVIFRMHLADSVEMTFLDFSDCDVWVMGLVSFGVAALALVLYVGILMDVRLIRGLGISALILCCMGINIYFIVEYHFQNQTFTEKTIMQDLGDDVGDAVVSGDLSYGYTLYNNIHPLANDPQVLRQYLLEDSNIYYLDYSDSEVTTNPKSIRQAMKPVHVYRRAYENYGTSSDIGLFCGDGTSLSTGGSNEG
jgi:4-amino-4-deoxy-L-arabinose transferase-like glycosyltransferase